MRSDIVPRGYFPRLPTSDQHGKPPKLSELQLDDPLILTLARPLLPKGAPANPEHAAFYPKIAVAYTQVATIATDDHHTLEEFRASVGAQWTFLSYSERTVQKDLDIQEYTYPDNNPIIPHTLVLKPGLVIYSIYNGYRFWGCPSVIDLWHELRAGTSEIRPDWDLSTPGLRKVWNADDFSRFQGWNSQRVGETPRSYETNSCAHFDVEPTAALTLGSWYEPNHRFECQHLRSNAVSKACPNDDPPKAHRFHGLTV
jgi:hypothetical protein